MSNSQFVNHSDRTYFKGSNAFLSCKRFCDGLFQKNVLHCIYNVKYSVSHMKLQHKTHLL